MEFAMNAVTPATGNTGCGRPARRIAGMRKSIILLRDR
jgi:hypothetical protein